MNTDQSQRSEKNVHLRELEKTHKLVIDQYIKGGEEQGIQEQ